MLGFGILQIEYPGGVVEVAGVKRVYTDYFSCFHTLLHHHCIKMNFSIKDFFSKCDQIHSFQRIWSHLLKKFLMENFIFCAVHF